MIRHADTVRTRIFQFPATARGAAEYHATLQVEDDTLPYEDQLQAILEAYADAADGKTVLLRRFFLSDPANQAARLEERLACLPSAATSVIGQSPLNGTKIAAWVYAVSGGQWRDGVFSHNGYKHIWLGGRTSGEEGSEAQMAALFREYDAALAEKGMDVAGNCLRTWIFVRDVDTHYGGVVKGRRDYFNGIGLTPQTHFIASTGIAGYSADPHSLVQMDACATAGLQPGQIRYLHAYDHLSPTALYGVTFERGTAVTYGDRTHVLISGTASIDSAGQVVHVGDPVKQTGRLLENVGALLSEAGAGFGDITYSIVYLRDTADYRRVRETFARLCPGLDPVYVLAPVCRPAWLVEMECYAITPTGNPAYAAF